MKSWTFPLSNYWLQRKTYNNGCLTANCCPLTKTCLLSFQAVKARGPFSPMAHCTISKGIHFPPLFILKGILLQSDNIINACFTGMFIYSSLSVDMSTQTITALQIFKTHIHYTDCWHKACLLSSESNYKKRIITLSMPVLRAFERFTDLECSHNLHTPREFNQKGIF